MNTNWLFSIKERQFHDKPQGQWFISGWYKDEKESYDKAETAWENKRSECYEQYVKLDVSHNINDLDMIDDYFHWRVTSPCWNLHSDGEWCKSLAKDGERYPNISGHFPSRDACEAAMWRYGEPPARFPQYENHLQSSGMPYSQLC